MEYILSDIIELIGGGTPKTSIPEYWDGDIPWLSVKDFSGEKRYVYETEKSITEEGLNNSSTKYLNQDDIIVSARGTVGEMAMIPFPMTFNQSCYGIRAKRHLVDPFYLYYLMKYNLGVLKSKVHGSVFDTITKDTFKQITVDLPCLEVQKKVAAILGNLDDKIEINEKINRNLWDQIDAWFYRLYTSDDAVRIMFGDVVTRCSERVKDDVVKVLSPVSTGEIVLSEDFFTKQVYSKDIGKYLKVNPYDFCYNPARANIGSIGMNDYDFTGCVSPVYVVFKTKNILKYYMSRYIRTDNFKAEVITRSSGSVRQALRYEDLVQIEFRKPNDYALEEFNEFYLGLKMKIESIKKENARLNDLRDCMLPRLMSGELDVSDLDIL